MTSINPCILLRLPQQYSSNVWGHSLVNWLSLTQFLSTHLRGTVPNQPRIIGRNCMPFWAKPATSTDEWHSPTDMKPEFDHAVGLCTFNPTNKRYLSEKYKCLLSNKRWIRKGDPVCRRKWDPEGSSLSEEPWSRCEAGLLRLYLASVAMCPECAWQRKTRTIRHKS